MVYIYIYWYIYIYIYWYIYNILGIYIIHTNSIILSIILYNIIIIICLQMLCI